MSIKKYTSWIIFLVLLNAVQTMYAQEEVNLVYRLPVNISRTAFLSPGFVYGIKAVSGEVKEFNYIMVRTYTVVGKADGSPVQSDPPVRIMVGFLGFSPSAVNSVTEMYTAPTDTAILPCVHNMLADLMVKKRMQFDFKDLKKLRIAMYNLNTEKSLNSTFQDKFLVSPGSSNLFFLIWDQYKEPGLPVAMQSCNPLIIDVTAPLKFKNTAQPAIAQAIPPSAPKETAKPVPAPVVPPAAALPARETSKEKSAVPSPEPKPQNPEPKPQNPEPKPQNPEPKTQATASPSGLIHEIAVLAEEFLAKNKIDISKVQVSYSLNKRIDTLKINVVSEKGEKSYFMPVPQYPPVPVKFSQTEDSRRKGEDDIEFPDIVKLYAGKLIIKFYNQALYFDTITSCVLIPKAFAPVDKIRAEGLESAVTKFVIDDKGVPTALNVQLRVPKTPLKLTVLDKKTSLPIKNLDLKIYYKNKLDYIYYGSYNSGEELTNRLFNFPGVVYKLLLSHPDYDKLKQSIIITSKDFDRDLSFSMDSKRAYNMIYVDISAGNRMTLKTILQEKIATYSDLKIPFLMVVSNGQKPMIIKDHAAFSEFISKIGIAMTLQPSAKEDRDAILNNLPLDSLSKVNNIQFQYFLSTDTYASSADGLINDLLKDLKLYIKAKPDIYIYINYDIPNDRKNPEYLYHTISN